MNCRIHVARKQLLQAHKADYPVVAPRFRITYDDDNLVITAKDASAFRAASSAVWNTLAVSASMERVK